MTHVELGLAYHWSPLELENMNIGMAKLIHTVITIGAHWSPLESKLVKTATFTQLKHLKLFLRP